MTSTSKKLSYKKVKTEETYVIIALLSGGPLIQLIANIFERNRLHLTGT
jgi:hypothetical protein